MICWSRYLFIALVIGLGTASMLTACGQKGPLVLPEENPSAPSEKAGVEQANDLPQVDKD